MKKLYLYPNAKRHVHDDIPMYVNCVPMSEWGIKNHFELTENPQEADYFYMGQFDDSIAYNFPNLTKAFLFYEEFRDKHICDIEGDWPNLYLPEWLSGSIVTVNGLYKVDKKLPLKYLVRPTFSKLFVHLASSATIGTLPFSAGAHQFGFKGLMDPHGVRFKVATALTTTTLPYRISFNPTWNGPSPIHSDIVKEYQVHMVQNTFALCPRGNGKDSVRFFEACFFNRVPIVIGSNVLFGEGYANLDFVEYIDENLSISKIAKALEDIYERNPPEVAWEKGLAARSYFEEYVRDYMNDPTAYFIKWCLQQ